MATLAKKLSEQVPRGYRNVADHMLRSASNTVLLLAEGANRRGAGEKRQRFVESRGECAEVGAASDLLLVYGIGSRVDAEMLKSLASRAPCSLGWSRGSTQAEHEFRARARARGTWSAEALFVNVGRHPSCGCRPPRRVQREIRGSHEERVSASCRALARAQSVGVNGGLPVLGVS